MNKKKEELKLKIKMLTKLRTKPIDDIIAKFEAEYEAMRKEVPRYINDQTKSLSIKAKMEDLKTANTLLSQYADIVKTKVKKEIKKQLKQ